MKDLLQANMRSMNYSEIADIHALFEHAHFGETMIENSLNALQKLRKLEMLSINHAIVAASFEAEIPKFFAKHTTHDVVTSKKSLLEIIANW